MQNRNILDKKTHAQVHVARPFALLAIILWLPNAGASTLWSKDAHELLINLAFPAERGDCLRQMKQGSDRVDGLDNQIEARSFMHAMRYEGQSLEFSRDQANNYIQSEYEIAADLFASSTEDTRASDLDPLSQYTSSGRIIRDMGRYLEACHHRGRGLHTVTDTTSPAHANHAIWKILDHHFFDHGDLPHTLENETHLLDNPDVKMKTVGLMRIVDQMYLQFGMKDFRFEK